MQQDIFQSTPSLRKVTFSMLLTATKIVISIHTFLAEGDDIESWDNQGWIISIHTFLAEGDMEFALMDVSVGISIHTFLAEGDRSILYTMHQTKPFQSTPSLRKVTHALPPPFYFICISIHTFLAEGDGRPACKSDRTDIISIHTFLAEGDW